MIRLFAVKFIDAELSLLRWLILHKWTTGAAVLSTILQIRQARERIINVRA